MSKGRLSATTKNRTCQRDACNSPVAARDLCRRHYSEAYFHGELELRPRYEHGSECGVAGCDKPSQTRGFCNLHYGRLLRYGDPLTVGRRGRSATRAIPDESSPTRLAAVLGVSRQRAEQILNPEAHRARCSLNDAVKRGLIVKPSFCERCYEPFPPRKLHGHHWDYREPLDVRWLCGRCHGEIHTLINVNKKTIEQSKAA